MLRKMLLTKLFVNKKLNKRIANKVVCKLLVVVLLGEVGEADVEDLVHEDLLIC